MIVKNDTTAKALKIASNPNEIERSLQVADLIIKAKCLEEKIEKMSNDCQEAINTTWRFIGAYKKENDVPINLALKSAEYHLKEADWIFE